MAKIKKETKRELSESEILKLDNFNLKLKSSKYEIEILKLRKELTIKQFNEKILEASDEANKISEKMFSFNKELKEKFKIEGDSWGYDPLTGEINE